MKIAFTFITKENLATGEQLRELCITVVENVSRYSSLGRESSELVVRR